MCISCERFFSFKSVVLLFCWLILIDGFFFVQSHMLSKQECILLNSLNANMQHFIVLFLLLFVSVTVSAYTVYPIP